MSDRRLIPAAYEDAPIVRVWRHRDYALLMTGIGPYYFTSWMQRVGVGWLAWELTHSPGWLGAVAAVDLAPMLLISPFAGAMVDRWDPVKQMKFAMIAVILHAAVLAWVTMAGWITIELLFVLTLVNGMIMPVYNAARQTIVPATVPRSDFASAISLDSSFFHGSRFVGPMIAALTILYWGIGATFLAHVLGSGIFTLQVFRLRLPPRPAKGAVVMGEILADILEGWRYVWAHTGIFVLFMTMTVASLSVRPLQDFLPGFAGGVFNAGANGLAWLTSSMGVGAMCGASWIAFRGHTKGLPLAVVTCVLGLALSTLGFVATPSLWVAVVFSVLQGFTLTVMATSISTLTQSAVSDAMRGRVMSLFAMIYRGVPAVGALIIGFSAEGIGLRWTFAIAALVCVVLWLTVLPRIVDVDRAMRGEPRS
jgi:MFS family permease